MESQGLFLKIRESRGNNLCWKIVQIITADRFQVQSELDRAACLFNILAAVRNCNWWQDAVTYEVCRSNSAGRYCREIAHIGDLVKTGKQQV